MIFNWIIVWAYLFQISLMDSDKTPLKEDNPVLSVELIAEKDTVAYSEPINIMINLENISDKTVFIPQNFSATSNLLPNGLSDKVYDGALIHFNIQPVSTWAAIYTENVILSEPQNFIKLKPRQSHQCKYNFALHIKAINEFINQDDSLSIQAGKAYQLQARYENNWPYKKRESLSFIGSLQSNQITIFLKED